MTTADVPAVEDLIYHYLAREWGQKDNTLSETKCRILQREIPELRARYATKQVVRYRRPNVRRAYLASFGPRYARLLSTALDLSPRASLNHCRPWHKREVVVVLFGGGPALELFGLAEWLHGHSIRPKYLHVVIIDREHHWRGFHNFWFSEAIASRFRKTQIIPSYEAVHVGPDSSEQLTFPFAQAGLLARAELIAMTNFLSEIPDRRTIEQPLRYLTRLPSRPCVFACIDSAAKKWRPRMSWLPEFFKAEPLRSRPWRTGLVTVDSGSDGDDDTSKMIFGTCPTWVRTAKRWIHTRRLAIR